MSNVRYLFFRCSAWGFDSLFSAFSLVGKNLSRPSYLGGGRGKIFRPLMPISPRVTYFPWEGVQVLRQNKYELIVNLSIRSQAANLAGELQAEAKLGPVASKDGVTHILGNWQLYRASVVENNRHNLFTGRI